MTGFIIRTIGCINTWDLPVYAVLFATVLIVQTILEKRMAPKVEIFVSVSFCLLTVILLYALSYLFYWPFYAFYQQLYVNGLGLVQRGSTLADFLTIFCLWLFLALSFFLLELYRWLNARSMILPETRRIAGYILLCAVVLTFVTLLGLRTLLLALLSLGIFLFVAWGIDGGAPSKSFKAIVLPVKRSKIDYTAWHSSEATTRFLYVLLLLGLCITLGQETVYVRDFLDGGDYFRMNTVFKFSLQAWLLFAIGGALAVHQLYKRLAGFIRLAWL